VIRIGKIENELVSKAKRKRAERKSKAPRNQPEQVQGVGDAKKKSQKTRKTQQGDRRERKKERDQQEIRRRRKEEHTSEGGLLMTTVLLSSLERTRGAKAWAMVGQDSKEEELR
jgi:sRNA-binding protein